MGLERFWAKTKVSNSCLLWTGRPGRDGYPKIKAGGVTWRAHRYIYEQCVGPAGEVLMHSCDTPMCVSLQHLSPGTPKANHDDMKAKGRGVTGSKNGRAVLSAADIPALQAKRYSGMTYKAIGEEYSVTGETISNILRGKTWR